MGTNPAVNFRELHRRLLQLGFDAVRQKGSHVRYVHPDGRRTTVPDHGTKDVPKGLLSKIVKHDIGLDLEEFFRASDPK